MKKVITITARMKSKRLPLKIMRYIEDIPLIEHLINRLKISKLADEIIMCTSTNPQDDILIDVAEKKGIKWFRGSEDDVLDRIFNAAQRFGADFIVSTTADNPLTDPIYIDRIFKTLEEEKADFVTCKKLPLGAFSYGLNVKALKKVIDIKKETDTEIWGHIFERVKEFKKIDLDVEDELNHPEIRLTVDEKEDLELMRRIFAKFYIINKNFVLKEVVHHLLDNSELININKSIIQKTHHDKEGRKMEEIRIEDKIIGERMPCFIIAEAGVNHNGGIELAKKLVDAAKEAGVDAVKFQTFKAELIVTESADQAEYQKETAKDESQFAMLKKLELNEEHFKELKQYCDDKGIIFLSTPHSDKWSVDILDDLVAAYKTGSGDINNLPILKYMAKKGKPLIVATGTANLEEVREAKEAIESEGNKDIILLHCTTMYPSPENKVNLRAMETMRKELGGLIGYSDHTTGLETPIIAACMNPMLYEKHFTLDKNMEGPDHKASLNPEELKAMVEAIRYVEENKITDPYVAFKRLNEEKDYSLNAALIETILGKAEKVPEPEELEVAKVARKSVVAIKDIKEGEELTEENAGIRRPGEGLAPKNYEVLLGKKAVKFIKKDNYIMHEDIL